jgi:hypothetical protein
MVVRSPGRYRFDLNPNRLAGSPREMNLAGFDRDGFAPLQHVPLPPASNVQRAA